jgi:hypothetical protein
MRSWVSCAWVTCLVLGCGPKPEAKAPAPKPLDSAPQIAEEAPDLSPVKRPAEVVVVGRIAHPRLVIDTLTKWSSLPLRLEDAMPPQARPLARAVLWEAPIEMVVSLDVFGDGKLPTPLIVGSVGLKSVDAALSAADAMQMPVRKLAPGVYRVGDFPDASCAIAVSLGAAPARLVCGRGNKDVDVLLPYATRGLPGEPQTGADFELTLDAKPIQDHYGHDVGALKLLAGVGVREVALDSPRFDRALSDAIYGGVDETINLFNDLEQLRIDGRIDAARNVLTGSAELRLKGQSSWLAGTIAVMKPAPVPATLGRLPADTTLASYNVALPAERYAAISRILGELTEGFLEHEKLPEATRKRARHVLDAWLSKMPETFGFSVSPKDSGALQHLPTSVSRISEPSGRILGATNDFFALLADPALKRYAKQKAKFDDKMWPKVKKSSLKLAGFKTAATVYEVSFDLKALAALNDKLFEALKNMLPLPASNEQSGFFLVIQPDGDSTYVLNGDDKKEMARVMAEHKKAEPGVPFAKPAHNERVISAGFLTLAHIARSLERSREMPKLSKALANAPSHGSSPISFSSTVGAGSARIDVEIPAAVLSDVSSATISLGPQLKDALEPK